MVKDVLRRPVDTIGEAAEKMNAANVGAVVVVEDFSADVASSPSATNTRRRRTRARALCAGSLWMTVDPVAIEPGRRSTGGADHVREQLRLPVVKDGGARIVSLKPSRWAFDHKTESVGASG